ncbi:MAG: alpha/beta fold hydrolase [Anaerolineales bacterium]|nr:alpha/beta fold hydrolase [Anaerolineales bacterium]MCS7247871.1 alpha/beta fold hydrolase [Anaerolineales bacterium]MDW8161681.1 alpha/beta fold hydrolase [Anaerolineales bacterium]MDW8447518.1 alpha/beta fold hydrolase [Anaerolineales bacterium]
MSVIILRSQVVHYETLGRGKPVLFLHGWIGSWRYWVPAMQIASTAFRTYALDLWGFGDTAKVAGNYSLKAQVELVKEFLSVLGIGKIACVGHGLGALVASQFAQQSPQQVDRLLLVGLPWRSAINGRIASANIADLAEWLLGTENGVSQATRVEARKADLQAVRTSVEELRTNPFSQVLASLSVPYLLVYGLNDPLVPLPEEGEMTGLPPNAHWIVLEASAHYPMLEESAKFNRLLMDFLNLNSGQSPRDLQLKEEWKRRVR